MCNPYSDIVNIKVPQALTNLYVENNNVKIAQAFPQHHCSISPNSIVQQIQAQQNTFTLVLCIKQDFKKHFPIYSWSELRSR